jgi:hypothetical protein
MQWLSYSKKENAFCEHVSMSPKVLFSSLEPLRASPSSAKERLFITIIQRVRGLAFPLLYYPPAGFKEDFESRWAPDFIALHRPGGTHWSPRVLFGGFGCGGDLVACPQSLAAGLAALSGRPMAGYGQFPLARLSARRPSYAACAAGTLAQPRPQRPVGA